MNDFLDKHISNKKLVILGEYHGSPPIISLQTQIQESMANSLKMVNITDDVKSISSSSCPFGNQDSSPKVRVILEHFSMDEKMQEILNGYSLGSIGTKELIHSYKSIGTEGHNLIPYTQALESAQRNNYIHLYGGFIPRTYARLLMKEGKQTAIHEAQKVGYISLDETLEGTHEHYNYFESLLTGRNMFGENSKEFLNEKFWSKMFPAQILKDASMAYCVRNLETLNLTGKDKLLLVCGTGHMLYSHGVPERILSSSTLYKDKDDMLRIACLPLPEGQRLSSNKQEFDTKKILKDAFGGPDFDAADFCFIYEEEDEKDVVLENSEKVREETRQAYEKVGATAHLEGGDLIKAKNVLSSLYYNHEEIEFLGKDAVNYQGVGCPHRFANIQEGEVVLDMGSGLGCDSLLAAKAVSKTGCVIGIDLSNECVSHANKRAKERCMDDVLSFVQSPIEDIGKNVKEVVDESCDVIISNGAFCLLHNKEAGFAECYRLLKQGGRIAICTTVVKDKLEDGVEWPLCMETFAKQSELIPMLSKLGFVDVEVDMSDSLMEVYVEEESEEAKKTAESIKTSNKEGRFKIHNNDEEEKYRHLENFDMNSLCARVVILARKP